MRKIVDFKVRNEGAKVILILLDEADEEVLRLTMSWISGLRLLNEATMAVNFGLLTLENKVRKVAR